MSKKGAVAGAGAAIALAVGLVVVHEGKVNRTYADPIGILTSCYGHVGPENTPGRTFTDAECEAFLRSDLGEAQRVVHRCITAPMEPHQEAALISFAYNVGPGRAGVKDGLCVLKNGRQPQIRQKANRGDWAGACAALSDWVRAGGVVFRGLVKRRADERAMCEGKHP